MEITTSGLRPFIERSLWVASSNNYAHDVVARIKRNPPVSLSLQKQLAQYIAASVTLHTNDGWSYLGRSVSSLLAGDTHRALHLAYYAELRAALSLLAASGIGVFDHQHYVVSAANRTTKLPFGNGTHQLAWLALEEWSKLPASGALFSKLIRPEGRSLDDWFSVQSGVSPLAPQAESWFQQWGMDLSRAHKDREARNSSSYRPDGVPMTWQLKAKEGLAFVRDMWTSLEPSAASSFDQIDRSILRIALERYFFGKYAQPATAADSNYVKLIDDTISVQNFVGPTANRWREFLLRQNTPTDPLLFRYASNAPRGTDADLFGILARAVLLLRVSTGSAQDLLQQSGFGATSLSFWWQKLGEARGLWKPGDPPSTLADLWADIEDGLREVEEIESTQPSSFDSVHGLAFGVFGRSNLLASHDRIGLWGLCPI